MNDGAFNYLVDTEGSRLSFRRDFDRMPFGFAHRLHTSDHFSFDALRAVSYTHLDVYKRQAMERPETHEVAVPNCRRTYN